VLSNHTVASSFLLVGLALLVCTVAQGGTAGRGTDAELRALYQQLIDAENAHNIAAVRDMVWDSPSALFVAKTKTPAEGNWAGFWGREVVVEHIHGLFAGTFHIEPAYAEERIVLLTNSVAETYVPVQISVAYGGQSGTPQPFLMIIDWVRVGHGTWKMATDIALPIPMTSTSAQ
jgi:hypothetical protein